MKVRVGVRARVGIRVSGLDAAVCQSAVRKDEHLQLAPPSAGYHPLQLAPASATPSG